MMRAATFEEMRSLKDTGRVVPRSKGATCPTLVNGRHTQSAPSAGRKRADALCAQHALRGLGGSDAHYVHPAWFLTCATAFDDTITSSEELVEVLHYGLYRPVTLPAVDATHLPVPGPVVR